MCLKLFHFIVFCVFKHVFRVSKFPRSVMHFSILGEVNLLAFMCSGFSELSCVVLRLCF